MASLHTTLTQAAPGLPEPAVSELARPFDDVSWPGEDDVPLERLHLDPRAPVAEREVGSTT